MSKLVTQFDEFLSAIEPGGKAVGYAAEAHGRVRRHLEQDEKFKDYLEGSFLYGSYKRNTAICEIKDVDIVLLTNFDPSEEKNTPQNVLRKVKDAINRHYNDAKNQQYQRRSIRVDDPLPEEKDAHLTLDVIPAYAPNGDSGPLLVPDRELKQWVPSHPVGHIKNAITLNDKDHGNGMYVPLVKLMKYWWRYQCGLRQPDVERPKPKGFWVECLTAENFDQNQESYADHFISVLENVSGKYSDVTEVPELEDPGLLNGEVIATSMNIDEFHVFMKAVNESLALARKAFLESDEKESSKVWRQIFGDKFPLAYSKKIICTPAVRGYLYSGDGKTKFREIASGTKIGSSFAIKFVVEGVPEGCDIFWRVINTGRHADSENGLRGNYFKAHNISGKYSSDGKVNWETSRYTGIHYVECLAISENQSIAGVSRKFVVPIKNPKW